MCDKSDRALPYCVLVFYKRSVSRTGKFRGIFSKIMTVTVDHTGFAVFLWGPFLERSGNVSSLEVNLNIKQLFGPEKVPGLSRNRPHPVTFQARKAALCLPRLHSRSKFQYF